MMKRITLACVMVLITFDPVYASAEKPEYSMELTLHPVRLSISDMANLLGKVQRYLNASGALKDENVHNNELALSDGVRRFEVTGDFSEVALRSAPDVTYIASYRFSARSGPLEEVAIVLADYGRTISVSGESQEQVEGLARIIYAELERHETYLGGLNARLAVFVLFQILAGVGMVVPTRVGTKIAMAALVVASFFVINWTSLLPGVAIYKGSPSSIVRYGPEISFISFLVTVAGLIVALLAGRKKGEAAQNVEKWAVVVSEGETGKSQVLSDEKSSGRNDPPRATGRKPRKRRPAS